MCAFNAFLCEKLSFMFLLPIFVTFKRAGGVAPARAEFCAFSLFKHPLKKLSTTAFPLPFSPLPTADCPTQGSTHRPLFPFAEQPPSRNFTLLSLRGKDTSPPAGFTPLAAGFAHHITDTPVEASACLNSRETTARRKLSPLAVTKQPPCRRTLPLRGAVPF